MPKFKTVTTTDGTNTFELRPQDFVEHYGTGDSGVEELGHRTTKAQLRKAISAFDKFSKKNPKPQPTSSNMWTGRNMYDSVTSIQTGYEQNRLVEGYEYNVTPNDFGGISIGCMVFDKKALNKLRTWANATAAKATTRKKSAKSAKRTLKAAA